MFIFNFANNDCDIKHDENWIIYFKKIAIPKANWKFFMLYSFQTNCMQNLVWSFPLGNILFSCID